MAREMREEDACLVWFKTNDRSGFGIDIGPGLPPGSRLIFYGFSQDSERRRLIVLAYEHDASVIIQRIDHATFEKKFSEMISYVASFYEKSHAVVIMARNAMREKEFRSDPFYAVDVSYWFFNHASGFLRKHFLSFFS